ncbi:hypothetical protein DFH07DRAFT_773193 [Mycena maculata]|uniref:Chromo domain-containing protein n=1 Tax=Mycena maculata TaxID=230809 RepID=A0AAD7J403_9AGAR|nr:hypothetical protein DFH07DRAFT_773193 [Mycena maculata]
MVEWELEGIVAQSTRKSTRGRKIPVFRVRYKGYGPEDDRWMTEYQLKNAKDMPNPSTLNQFSLLFPFRSKITLSNVTMRFSSVAPSTHIPKIHPIDKTLDNFLLSQALPTKDIMAACDAVRKQSRSSRILQAPNIFDRPLRPADVTEYDHDGVHYAELNPNVAIKLWNGLLVTAHYILAAAQHTTARSIRELRSFVPVDHLTSLGVPFPTIVTLKRHSGVNPFFANKHLTLEDLGNLYDRLQYTGRIALFWIDFTANQSIHHDSFGRWGWDHYNSLQPNRKKDTSLQRLLRAIGAYTSEARKAYFAGDEKFHSYNTDFDYSTTGHGKLGALQTLCSAPENPGNPKPIPTCTECGNPCRDMILHPGKSKYSENSWNRRLTPTTGESAYCRAHPTFDPYIPIMNPHQYIDASFDNTDALLPLAPPSSPVDAHSLAGYSRRDQHHAFIPCDLPTIDEDVEMVDVSAVKNDGTTDISDADMAAWVARVKLDERDAVRKYNKEAADRFSQTKSYGNLWKLLNVDEAGAEILEQVELADLVQVPSRPNVAALPTWLINKKLKSNELAYVWASHIKDFFFPGDKTDEEQDKSDVVEDLVAMCGLGPKEYKSPEFQEAIKNLSSGQPSGDKPSRRARQLSVARLEDQLPRSYLSTVPKPDPKYKFTLKDAQGLLQFISDHPRMHPWSFDPMAGYLFLSAACFQTNCDMWLVPCLRELNYPKIDGWNSGIVHQRIMELDLMANPATHETFLKSIDPHLAVILRETSAHCTTVEKVKSQLLRPHVPRPSDSETNAGFGTDDEDDPKSSKRPRSPSPPPLTANQKRARNRRKNAKPGPSAQEPDPGKAPKDEPDGERHHNCPHCAGLPIPMDQQCIRLVPVQPRNCKNLVGAALTCADVRDRLKPKPPPKRRKGSPRPKKRCALIRYLHPFEDLDMMFIQHRPEVYRRCGKDIVQFVWMQDGKDDKNEEFDTECLESEFISSSSPTTAGSKSGPSDVGKIWRPGLMVQ